jgi:hypothetical protein
VPKPRPPKREGRSVFKQALVKPEPWQFGGRLEREHALGSARAHVDAERLAGLSRKVH